MAKQYSKTVKIGGVEVTSVVEAHRVGGDDHWEIKHKDGLTTRLSDKKFKQRYKEISEAAE